VNHQPMVHRNRRLMAGSRVDGRIHGDGPTASAAAQAHNGERPSEFGALGSAFSGAP
jgi:hypothetical protein